MSIASDDNRDRPTPKGRTDLPGAHSAEETWRDYEPAVDDPLSEPGVASPDREVADRERWLRDYIDREQRFRLYFSKYIAGLLDHPSRGMKIWRWLIDDFRSEKREQAFYFNGGIEPGLLPWLRRRRRRRE